MRTPKSVRAVRKFLSIIVDECANEAEADIEDVVVYAGPDKYLLGVWQIDEIEDDTLICVRWDSTDEDDPVSWAEFGFDEVSQALPSHIISRLEATFPRIIQDNT